MREANTPATRNAGLMDIRRRLTSGMGCTCWRGLLC